MDPVIDPDWLTCKNDSIDEAQYVGNIARSWQWRELGINPPHYPSNKTVLENIAEDILVQKPLKIRSCDLPGYPRSTFLMVFSPDGTKVASTHGNHNVYVSELASGKHVRILKGHPRTPWCVAFHPSHAQLIGSGCLGGQVRVWDISNGGSEVWSVHKETVIASIAFHPREQLLVIATYNELYFWDWSQPAPFTRVSTNNVNEKVRYVAFDGLGEKLVTGISIWAGAAVASSLLAQTPPVGPMSNQTPRRDDNDGSPGGNRAQEEPPGTAQDLIVNSYQNLVQRYDSLVRNYQRLFMVRHRLTNTPPPPSTMDRGTDPMESDLPPGSLGWPPNTSTSGQSDNATPGPSTSRTQEGADSGDGDSSEGSRLLNLDALTFDNPPGSEESPQDHEEPIFFGFANPSSAFLPITEAFWRNVNTNETRLLPNPFAASSSRSLQSPPPAHSSRTSIFTYSRPDPSTGLSRVYLNRRRNSSPVRQNQNATATSLSQTNMSVSSEDVNRSPLGHQVLDRDPLALSPPHNAPTTSRTRTDRPSMTNSSTQMSPNASSVDAQTINESLDLIRDILRDSGTRLLNLITNMSLSTLASVERGRGGGPPPRSAPPRSARSRPSPLSPLASLRRDLLMSSTSDSDSDQSLEVNIFRTRNSTFRDEPMNTTSAATSDASERLTQLTDRMVFDLNDEPRRRVTSQDTGAINVSLSNDRFRVRTQGQPAENDREPPRQANRDDSRPDATENATGENADNPLRQEPLDFSRPSTSRDNFWSRNESIPSEEAFRKVRGGVVALQKHTVQLMNMWVRGNRIPLRELRTMWENLRRRILSLHRETARQDMPSYYTRSLLERCMMLTDMADNARNALRTSRHHARGSGTNDNNTESRAATPQSGRSDNSNTTESEMNTSADSVNDSRSPLPRSPKRRSASSSIQSSPSLRRRLHGSYRWRPEDELRRRTRNANPNRLPSRYSNRSRRDLNRAIEITATRHEIRMRAMQVLSIMFNMMMMCLEERGLSSLIIIMLRTLKKALALTCLMLMMNRNNSGRTGNTSNTGNTAPAAQRMDTLNVVRIQNVDHTGPVNVDGPDDPSTSNSQQHQQLPTAPTPSTSNSQQYQQLLTTPTASTSNSQQQQLPTTPRPTEPEPQSDETKAAAPTPDTQPLELTTIVSENASPSDNTEKAQTSQKWSNRLAVQIAAANRNTSATARNRRERYIQSKRMLALHRTNPSAHPIVKKKSLPPVNNHRIPAVRYLPGQRNRVLSPRREPRLSAEPVAGPSTERLNNAPGGDSPENLGSRDLILNEFDRRVNLVRLAHLQAMRLRNATRTRFRRLQAIRLYTPSSVREMFSLPQNNGENSQGNQSPQNGQEQGNRRSFAAYRHIVAPRSEAGNRSPEEPGHFHAVLNNVAVPLMQVNETPPAAASANAEAPANQQQQQQQRLPRIHEYLQPIILAQNAMVVDDEANEAGGGGGGGGARRISATMGGLLDSGIIETLPAPSHRVQAWDFTTGNTPDIADSTKNVVVQRCRIHNDASIDISKDGRLLVALLPVPRLRNSNHWLGVYSLEWGRLGQCLHTAVLEQSAVSVALSPTARHLAVGLGSRRFTTAPHARNNVFALLYRLEPLESSSRTGLSPIKVLEQNWEQGFTSLNCLRWAPQPGQGLVYANNTGQLIIMS